MESRRPSFPGSRKASFSLATLGRLIFLVVIFLGSLSVWLIHSASIATRSMTPDKEEFNADSPRQLGKKQDSRLSELESNVIFLLSLVETERQADSSLGTSQKELEEKVEKLLSQGLSKLEGVSNTLEKSQTANDNTDSVNTTLANLKKQVELDHQALQENTKILQELMDQTEERFRKVAESVDDLATYVEDMELNKKYLRFHLWDDTSNESPREDILAREGWSEYNGRALGDDDESVPPLFVETPDPGRADFIVWCTTMARHEQEVPPLDPVKHFRKVVVLDMADGCTIHKTRDYMIGNQTILGYLKRSFVAKGGNNTFAGNCTDQQPGKEVAPYQYSGSRAMMIPHDSPEASRNFKVTFWHGARVYGDYEAKEKASEANSGQVDWSKGYFKTKRYDNFLIPFQDRKWTVTSTLHDTAPSGDGVANYNEVRTNVVRWTEEYSREQAGKPRLVDDNDQLVGVLDNTTANKNDYTAYLGYIDKKCDGHCFGRHYHRHLRDAKIMVTCNPSGWEGDFRLWESFLSGALVMIDKMVLPYWMPNPPEHGKHWVVYDPSNKTDFVSKLRYYADPANQEEAKKIAQDGYEFVLKHHMAVNRVGYVLDTIRDKLAVHVANPDKRALLGLPPR